MKQEALAAPGLYPPDCPLRSLNRLPTWLFPTCLPQRLEWSNTSCDEIGVRKKKNSNIRNNRRKTSSQCCL